MHHVRISDGGYFTAVLERDPIFVRCVPVPTASLELWSHATVEESDGGSLGLARRPCKLYFLRGRIENGIQLLSYASTECPLKVYALISSAAVFGTYF